MPRKISVKKPSKPVPAQKLTPAPAPVSLRMPEMPTLTEQLKPAVAVTPKKPRRVSVLLALFAFLLAIGLLVMAYAVYLTQLNLTYTTEENQSLRQGIAIMQKEAALSGISGSMTTTSGIGDGTLSAQLKSAQDLQNLVLQKLSDDWKNDPGLSRGLGDALDEKYLFPNVSDTGENDAPPANGTHYYSLPSNGGDKILRAYFICTSAVATADAPVCGRWEEELWVYDTKTQGLAYVARLQSVIGSNFEYIDMPFAWSKDDRWLIVKDVILGLGAGGSATRPAYRTLDIAKGDNVNEQKPVFLATDSADFYDTFGKVIYLDQGDKSVKYIQPGPPNNSKVVYKNILGGQTKVLLEDPDTEYELTGIDSEKKVETYQATKYTFDDKCPRADGNQDCAKKETTDGEIELP